jgi:tetratricopeptide (TPR) repeat protein
VRRDPVYSLAYANIGDSYFLLADWDCMAQEDGYPKATAAALKAVELDPDSSEAHTVLAELTLFYEWNWPKSEKEFQRAIELNPNNAVARAVYAIYLTAMGRPEQGFVEIKKAEQLDPVSLMTNITGMYVYYLAHQYDQAIAQIKKTLELYPQSGAAYYWLGQCYERQGKEQEAVAAYLGPPPANGKAPALPLSLRDFWHQKFEKQAGGKSETNCWQIQISAHLGSKKKTLDLLEWGYQHHCDGLQFLKAEPIYDNLRDDARYTKLISLLGL